MGKLRPRNLAADLSVQVSVRESCVKKTVRFNWTKNFATVPVKEGCAQKTGLPIFSYFFVQVSVRGCCVGKSGLELRHFLAESCVKNWSTNVSVQILVREGSSLD